MKRLDLITAALLSATLLAPLPALAAIRALVVGIDNYGSKQQLRGSVADAGDLARVLEGDAAASVALLQDGEATRDRFESEWQKMVASAEPGDVLFLSFSGHGIRKPLQSGEAPTSDGYETGFLLQRYSETSAPDEILTDAHLYDLFAAATAKGAKVFFVADACHSGAALRAVDARNAGAAFRFQRFDMTAASPPPAAVDATAVARPPNPDVTVFSATDHRLAIQEVLVDGSYRGALSYSVARGLEGSAGNDGWVTAEVLHEFVSPLVRTLSGNRQIPQFTMPDEKLRLIPAPAGAPTLRPLAALPTIPVAILGSATAIDPEGAVILRQTEGAELIWDAGRQQMLGAAGDVLASGIGPEQLAAAINARRLLDVLNERLADRADGVTIVAESANRPDGAFFLKGDTAQFVIVPESLPYLTVLDLNASGNIQLLWPLEGDIETPSEDGALRFEAPITQPFGADTIIGISSAAPLTRLHGALARLHNTADVEALHAALSEVFASSDVGIGVETLFSCESLRSNGQCDTMLASSQ